MPRKVMPLALLVLGSVLHGQGFIDVAASAGIAIPANGWLQIMDRGVCWGDFDDDGDQDLIVPGLTGQPNRYLRNEGNGSFSDQSAIAGLGVGGAPRACVTADVDNDGDLDIYLSHSLLPGQLFQNDGSGHFIEAGAAAGVDHVANSFSAAFGDYDRDGWIDLYVGNRGGLSSALLANILYRNDGDGTFTDVTATAGVGDLGLTFIALWHDYDEDGWPDLIVGNDHGGLPQFQANTTYHNNGDGTFTDVGAAINTNHGISAMGADVADVFNDGGWDLFITNTPSGHLFHEWDPSTGSYLERAALYGLQANQTGWACAFFDYDNDGWVDLYINHGLGATSSINRLYRNPGAAGGTWSEVAGPLGLDLGGGKYSFAIADYDDDGDRDVLQLTIDTPALLMRNDAASGNWLTVKTVGTRSNRAGIGAVVKVMAGGLTQRRLVRSGTGFMGGSDLRCHFGLASAPIVDQIVVTWPSGQIQILDNVSINQVLTVVEPSLSSASPTIGTWPTLDLQIQGDAGLPYLMVLSLATTPGLVLSDGRVIPAHPSDPLVLLSITPGNPILPQPFGFLSSVAQGSATLQIPWAPVIVGATIYGTAVTAHPGYADGIKSIIDPPLSIVFE